MNERLQQVQEEALALCAPVFDEMKEISLYNTQKVLEAFRNHHLSAYHFAPSNGYGYGDPGREELEEIWEDIFKAESALVRSLFQALMRLLPFSLRSSSREIRWYLL